MKYTLVLLLLFLYMGCTEKNTVQHIDGDQITHTELNRRIQSLVDTAGVTGLAVTIFNDNNVAY